MNNEKIKRIINYIGWIIFPTLILFVITGTKYEQWAGIFVVLFIVGIFHIVFDMIQNKINSSSTSKENKKC